MSYYPFYLLYLGAGITICGVLFFWAVRNGQFQDQKRARHLPLYGEPVLPRDASSARWPRAMRLTALLIFCAVLVQVVLIVLTARTIGREEMQGAVEESSTVMVDTLRFVHPTGDRLLGRVDKAKRVH